MKETKDGRQAVNARTRKEWRKWLEKNHQSEKSVWLILYHKKSKVQSVDISDAMEEALCFGWIDSKAKKRDEESFYLTFSPRNPKSKWSNINKERAEKMIEQNLMTPGGQAMIDFAKKTGTWNALADVQNSAIPDDLQKLFDKNKTAYKNFQVFPPSSKRAILEWILNAKKTETRQQRIIQTVELAAKKIKANHYRQSRPTSS
jgi:uncharacterized protein YdeI (YjbR/CyaY-like superfamily)